MARRRCTPKLKAQVMLKVLSGGKRPGQAARASGVHPTRWGSGSGAWWSGLRRSSPMRWRSTSTSAGSGVWRQEEGGDRASKNEQQGP